MFKKLDPGPTIFGNPDLNLDPTSVKTPDPDLTKTRGSAFVTLSDTAYDLLDIRYNIPNIKRMEAGA